MPESRELRVKRLKYQSWYRGCKETDKILGSFARAELESLADNELDLFEQILAENDNDLFDYFTGKLALPAHLAKNPVMQKITEYMAIAMLPFIES